MHTRVRARCLGGRTAPLHHARQGRPARPVHRPSPNAPRADPDHFPTTSPDKYPPAAALGTDSEADDPEASKTGVAAVLTNVLAGLTVSLSMVPEALAFSVVAGVAPVVGLQTAAIMGVVAALCGSQPSSITGAAGAVAIVMGPLTAAKGPAYLSAAVLLAGAMQVVAGWARLGKFIRLVPQPVMLGFINGLALVIGISQLATFRDAAGLWLTGSAMVCTAGLTALTMAIIFAWERQESKLAAALPPPLVAIFVTTCVSIFTNLPLARVGDLAAIGGGLPSLALPQVPLNLATLQTILPFAASAAAVALIETLLTQQLLDELTGARTSTHVECIGQGIAQIASGLTGGMGGCAMVGSSLINTNAGGVSKVSGLTCGVALMCYVLFGAGVIGAIPMAALTGVMLMLIIEIFDFTSLARLNQVPRTDAAVLLIVTAVTYATNLAVAVAAGVVLASLSFAWQSAVRGVSAQWLWDQDTLVCRLRGPLFFGSIQSFKDAMRAAAPEAPPPSSRRDIVLDFMECRVWDSSAIDVINTEASRLQDEGWAVRLRHLSKDSRRLVKRAGDMVELEVMPDDPRYGLLSDYDAIVRNKGAVKRIGSVLRAPSSKWPRTLSVDTA